jgi:hypothetical protein
MPNQYYDLINSLQQRHQGLDRGFLSIAVNWVMAGDESKLSEEEIEKRVLTIMEEFC